MIKSPIKICARYGLRGRYKLDVHIIGTLDISDTY